MKTSCIGCGDIIATLNKIEADPPHLFFSGCYGAGKTTLATEFLKHYFEKHGVNFEDPTWCLQIRSDQDRGIHRIRETITEFVRRITLKENVYRWIFIDDADSLPVLSQQALRRPMETHYHTTRFLFCSRYSTDLIPALRSRCLHIECTPLPSLDAWNVLAKEYDLPTDEKQRQELLMLSPTINELKLYGPLWRNLENRSKFFVNDSAQQSDTFYNQCLRALLQNDKEVMVKVVMELYGRGHSFEDCLYILSEYSKNCLILKPYEFERLQKFFIQGWIYTTQGRTGFLDLLDLFLSRRWDEADSRSEILIQENTNT